MICIQETTVEKSFHIIYYLYSLENNCQSLFPENENNLKITLNLTIITEITTQQKFEAYLSSEGNQIVIKGEEEEKNENNNNIFIYGFKSEKLSSDVIAK